jgi:hypothetical protein
MTAIISRQTMRKTMMLAETSMGGQVKARVWRENVRAS